MKLAAMRYKDYVWPHNPRTYTIDYERRMAAQKVPFGRYHLQDLGLTRRVMKGEGEFVGPTAYEEFKKLASVFYQSATSPDRVPSSTRCGRRRRSTSWSSASGRSPGRTT